MKYLENLPLEQLSISLTDKVISGGRVLNGRIEVFSTKKAGDDKKQSKALEHKLTSSVGEVEMSKSTKKILIDLIQTLNASLIDYDFSELTAESFAIITISDIVASINSNLAELTVDSPNYLTDMWKSIDESMNISQCEGYCLTEDPFAESEIPVLWSFIYFLFNKELKRICMFSCMATSRYRRDSIYGNSMDDDEDYEFPVPSSQGDEELLGVEMESDEDSMDAYSIE